MNTLCIIILACLRPTWSYHRAMRLQPEALDVDSHINLNKLRESRHAQRQSPPSSSATDGFDWYADANLQSSFSRRRSNWNTDTDNQDRLVFEDDFENRNYIATTTRKSPTRRRQTTHRIPTSTLAIPGMGTPRTPCEDKCLSTPEYNPVCGDDDMTYFSQHRLKCAQRCGKRVNLKHLGACSLIPPRG